MRIHTVKKGESTEDIAREYGINERILKTTNEIGDNERIVEGEELLILTPTRTYTATDGDSLMRVALRFGQSPGNLRGLNPHIMGNEIKSGETVVVKCDARPYGMGTANGIFYKGCPMWKLNRAIPYLTYLTVGAGAFDGQKITFSFNGKEIVDTALSNGKLPLLRVYDGSDGRNYKDSRKRKDYIKELIKSAEDNGYGGILLSSRCRDYDYENFLVELRGEMIGNDLILFSEVTEKSPLFISDYSDGAILTSDENFQNDLTKFATDKESTKTLVELPVFGFCEDGSYICVNDSRGMAEINKSIFERENEFLLYFTDKKHGRICINSLSGIKKRLDIIADLGYMGISFDIARCPLSYLLMYDALFKSVGYACVDKRVRCNNGS